MISAGAKLVEQLDRLGVSPDAAFWFYFPDIGEWKLVLAEVKLGAEGPREVYRQIQRALIAISRAGVEIMLSNVAVAKPDAPIVKVLQSVISTGPGVTGMRFMNSVIDGNLIEGAYVYRMRKTAA